MSSTPDSESGNLSSNLGGTSCEVRMCLGARDTIVVIASRVKMQNPSFAKRKLFCLRSIVKFAIVRREGRAVGFPKCVVGHKPRKVISIKKNEKRSDSRLHGLCFIKYKMKLSEVGFEPTPSNEDQNSNYHL